MIVIASLLVLFLFVALAQRADHAVAATTALLPMQEDGPDIVMSMTVGTDADIWDAEQKTCRGTVSLVLYEPQKVFLCYEVKNTGTVSFTNHTLVSTDPGKNFANATADPILLPGGVAPYTTTEGINIEGSVVITSVWTAISLSGSTASYTDSVNIEVLNPDLTITYTVGQDQTRCGDSNKVTAFPGGNVVHCLQLHNSGQLTLTDHTIELPALGLQAQFPYNLAPGEVITIDEATRQSYGISHTMVLTNVSSAASYTAKVTSSTPANKLLIKEANASVDIHTQGLSVRFVVSPKPDECPPTDSFPVANTQYYLCVGIHNSSNITYTHHNLTLFPQNIALSFDADVGASKPLSITNTTLVSILKQSPVFGPFTMTGNIAQSVILTSTSPEGYQEIKSDQRTLLVATPTTTPTKTPATPFPNTPTWTATTGPSATPTATFTPVPSNTPTATPVDTPSPTVQSFAISILATPTSPIPTIDPNAPFATQTQIAVEQTAQAAQFQTPTVDPIIQMTEQAIFATQTYEAMVASGQIPPPVDPNATPIPPTIDPNSVALPPTEAAIAPMVSQQENTAPEQASPLSLAPESPLDTPTETQVPEPTMRPIIFPTPQLPASTLSIFGIVAGRVFTVASWIWLFIGSIVFLFAAFVLMVVVLRSFGSSEYHDQFDLVEDDELDEPEPLRPDVSSSNQNLDDWPDSLP